MAETVTDTYGSIRSKIQVIVSRQQMLVQEIENLRAENLQLKGQIGALEKELAQAKVDGEYLTVASVIAHKREDVEMTRSLLAGLVRDIDRCIAELSAC